MAENSMVDTNMSNGDLHGELTGHEYDGIQEYDNPLPGWWKWLFAVTIFISFPYFAYYHFGAAGRSVEDAHAIASAEVGRLLFAKMGELKPDKATLVKFMYDDGGLSVGKSIYKANCVSCHGKDGEGLVGPNLTDQHYKNVRSIEDILNVVNKGAAGGAMPPWLNRIGETERILVSSYVASLRGTVPGGPGRPPEGREIDPWPSMEEVQSTDDPEPASEEDAGEKDEAGSGDAKGDADVQQEPADRVKDEVAVSKP
jgi:cytochrome c oxidase cbb3-type subunit III